VTSTRIWSTKTCTTWQLLWRPRRRTE